MHGAGLSRPCLNSQADCGTMRERSNRSEVSGTATAPPVGLAGASESDPVRWPDWQNCALVMDDGSPIAGKDRGSSTT